MEKSDDKERFKSSDPHYRCYAKITKRIKDWPLNLFDCEQSDTEKLAELLNSPENFKIKLAFITGYILPQITVHTKKISSTPHNLVDSIDNPLGASGTTNTDTLPLKLKTVEFPDTPIGSILSMWKNSRKSIFTVEAQEAGELLRTTISDRPDYRVIIDVDSTFRDLRDEKDIARIIFEATAGKEPSVDALSYYDESGQNLVLMRPKPGEGLGMPMLREHCTVSLDNIFVFMRQSSAVGADTPMPMTAKALVTVGSSTQRDLFLQGVGRMRGILTGQEVGFIIQKKDEDIFKGNDEEISLKSILRLVSKNQGEQRGLDLFFNLRLLLQNFVESRFWDFFDDRKNSMDECIDLFKALEDFFVENSVQDQLNSLTRSQGIITIEEAINQMRKGFIQKLEPMLKNENVAKIIDLNVILKNFDKQVEEVLPKLPKMIKLSSAEDGEGEVEVEAAEKESAEVEVEAANEAQEENEEENEKENSVSSLLPPSIPYKLEPNENYETLGINHTLSVEGVFKPYSQILQDFYISDNFFQEEGALKTAYEYLVIRENNQFKVVLIDHNEGKATLEKMMKDPGPIDHRDYYLMSSTGKVIIQNAREVLDEDSWKENAQLTLLTKVFSRQLDFTSEEIDYLASLKPEIRDQYFDLLNKTIAYFWPPIAPTLAKLCEQIEKEALMVS